MDNYQTSRSFYKDMHPGGVSKVDSETYPVADNLTLTWYSGIGREASVQRWA